MARRTYRRPRLLSGWTDHQLHATAVKIRREWWAGEASDRQSWFLDRILDELQLRADREGPARACVCELCFVDPRWLEDGAMGPEDPS